MQPVVKICGPTAGCGRSMSLDARFCPYCGKDQGGCSTFYQPAPGQSYFIPFTLGEPINFTILPGACVPVFPDSSAAQGYSEPTPVFIGTVT